MQLTDDFRGEFTVESLAKILSDHQNSDRDPRDNPVLPAWGYSICNHGTWRQSSYLPEELPWGTVSGEILQPSKKQFWYAYGWPCGLKPEYREQLYQEHSWGKFVPFGFDKKELGDEILALTDPSGNIK